MKSIRGWYARLPEETRVRIRSLAPAGLLRWYAHKNTDVYLLSYPKCGRTWLRLMLGKAIACHFAVPMEEDILFLRSYKALPAAAPRITVIHDDRPMLKTPDELETSKEKYRDKRVIFLVRDPRDVIVSSYFEMTKRGRIFGENPYESRRPIFEGSLPAFIRNPVGGFDTLLCFYNIWAENQNVPKGFLLLRYEDLKADPPGELQRALDFIGLAGVEDAIIAEAVEFASFENMRKMEAENRFQSGILNPGDAFDQDTYKTRKGVIGGYKEHLSEEEIAFLNQKMKAELSPFFGYGS